MGRRRCGLLQIVVGVVTHGEEGSLFGSVSLDTEGATPPVRAYYSYYTDSR